MKRAIVGTLVVAAVLGIAAVVIWHFWPQEAVNLEEYVPSEEFMPAYEALQVDEPDYDIEETGDTKTILEAMLSKKLSLPLPKSFIKTRFKFNVRSVKSIKFSELFNNFRIAI